MKSGEKPFKQDDVERMIAIIEGISKDLGVNNYRVPDIGPGINLSLLFDENGLIPPLMMKMDIDSLILTGKRIWNTVSIVDRETLFGMSCKSNFEDPEGTHGSDHRDSFFPELMARHAFSELVQFDHQKRSCSLKPLPIYYLYNLNPEEGSEIELPPLNIVYSVAFNEMSMRYWEKYDHSVKNQPNVHP